MIIRAPHRAGPSAAHIIARDEEFMHNFTGLTPVFYYAKLILAHLEGKTMETVELFWLWFAGLSAIRKIAAIAFVIFVVYAVCELVAWSNWQITGIISSYRRRYPRFEDLKKDIRAFSERIATMLPIFCVLFPVFVWLLNKIWYMKIERPGGDGTDPRFGVLVEKGFLLMFLYSGLGGAVVSWLYVVDDLYKGSMYHRKTKTYWGLYLVPFLLVAKIIKRGRGDKRDSQ